MIHMIEVKGISTLYGLPGSALLGRKDNQKRERDNRKVEKRDMPWMNCLTLEFRATVTSDSEGRVGEFLWLTYTGGQRPARLCNAL